MQSIGGDIHVLHVDDEPDFAALAGAFVEREDDRFTVESATSAEAGLERLADGHFDCVVSDYDMPGTNGLEFLEAVRATYPDLPFILFTGKGSEEIASRAISAGVTDYLQKEHGTDQYTILANRIRNAVEGARAERERRRMRERMELALEETESVIFEMDFETGTVSRHGAVESFFELDPERISTKREYFERFVHPDDRARIRASYERLRTSDQDHAVIEYRTNPDLGSVRWLQDHMYVTSDDSGTRVLGLARDITERKQRERELEQYEAYLQNSTDIVTVLDDSGTIKYGSPSITRILGYEPGELIGEHAFDYVHPDDVDRALEAFRELVTEPGATLTAEFRFRTAADEWCWLEVRGTNQLDNPAIEGVVVNNRDITERKTREQELQLKERRYQAVFNDPNILVGLLDTDGTVRDINRTAMEYVDATSEELIGIPFWETPWFEHSDAVQDDIRTWIDRAANGEYVEFDLDLVRPDGEPYTVEGVFRPVLNDVGEVVSLIVSDREVTERKERERDLERIWEFFTEAERLGSLGAWEFDADDNVVWTDGTRRIHEVDDSFDPTLEKGLSFFHPDDRESVERAVTSALERGESYDLEARLLTAQDNERWVRIHGKPMEDSDTSSVVRGYIQDITDQKRREQELDRAKSQLEAAVEAGEVATWEWHVPENELVAGPEFARKFGVDPDEARDGVSLDRFLRSIHEEDRDRIERRIQAVLDECGSYEEEYRVWNAAGELRWVVARGHVACDDDGTPLRFPGVLSDITERKETERELKRKNERLDEFTSIVSHDLRSPLAVAEGNLELARRECDSERLASIRRAHERMRTLIDDLLTLARQGESLHDVSAVDLAGFVDTCWRTVETGTATLSVDIDRTIRADESRLRQLFENLFRNAVVHGGADVTITVGEMDGGFFVEDDGRGIPDDLREEVFDAGFSTETGGTGFGLSIVEQVAVAHGWEVSVTEGSLGGARFEITGVAFVED
ncbi:hybrid sensor histidine kinase/response regulator [Salinigranum rubrum]|uniref:histidine kinase n=1 Tax=Salinigranum rubrum TaxID=755307 RepID=A0A2I8VKT9_9EURY|nr:PAS domain-containing protein [Salinigranum rubrum]AUV82553.1 hybrid sensor histidine kinase/response regulator [Salinigranum rubrum]